MVFDRVLIALCVCLGLSFAGSSSIAQVKDDDPDYMQEEGMVLYRAGNYDQAISVWSQKAENGDLNAAYQLSVVFSDGQVKTPDFDIAAKYLTQAAEGGDLRAQFDLGSFYDAGYGVRRDIKESFRWYSAAAKQGMDAAMFNTAMMYYDGAGTERNLIESYRWMYLANQAGIAGLGDVTLERIASELTAEELKQAIKLARSTFE